jgi:hypothetical protein
LNVIASRADPAVLSAREVQSDADAVLTDAYALLLAAIRRNRAARLAADPQRGEPLAQAGGDDGQPTGEVRP